MRQLLNRLRHEDDAATAVEYSIIAAVVGVALIAAFVFFRDRIGSMLGKAGNVIANQ